MSKEFGVLVILCIMRILSYGLIGFAEGERVSDGAMPRPASPRRRGWRKVKVNHHETT
jgi:hypothetical protein